MGTCDAERAVFNQDIATALETVYLHKEAVEKLLGRVRARVASVHDELVALTV